jgi:hypothetical protein
MPGESEIILSDDDFIKDFRIYGAAATAAKYRINIRTVFNRRRRLEDQHGIQINVPTNKDGVAHPSRIEIGVKNGVVLVGSDFHIWPGEETLALKVFKKFAGELNPTAVILNGDVLDFPQISRHPPVGWENTPSPIQEIEAAQDHLNDISKLCKRARKIWTLGNHDLRFSSRLATAAREMKGIKGVSLHDYFGLWEHCWAVWVNQDVVVKHRFKGGIHATHNNTLWGGKSLITGHLHSAKVTPLTDYNGTRWGVDTGCIADPYSKQFNYTEDNPVNWISAFGVLTFRDGKLMPPELVTKWDSKHMAFRGQLYKA